MVSIFITMLLNLNMINDTEKPKLIYVGDPMCSWCYGISEEFSKIVNHYGEKIEVEIVMGGLRAGGGEEWNTSFKTFLRHHWEEVGMKSGQPFSFKLLEQEHFDYDTEPACRAVVVAGEINKTKMFPFFKEVQFGFYVGNNDPKEVTFYEPICLSLGIDYVEFSSKFNSEEMKKKTIKHFNHAAELGARSFPTILFKHQGETHHVAIGYSTFAKMKERIEAMLH